ncbi:MAG: GDP-mannose 4,6-dehydratase, partial [Clostridiales bacterium]|nr:GDP-mannose 4,6-dehydratase [Clostridiales bacterium]
VTTDKVYEETDDNIWGYREIDRLNGFEPYSNSKSCSELVTASYYRSFLKSKCISVSTARAGNVIGGGDTSKDRIIPDCVRAAVNGETIVLRNPNSVRPYQHVLEPLFAYLLITSSGVSDNFNVGPNDDSCVTTGELTDLFCNAWGGVSWEKTAEKGVREAGFLKLDNSKIKSELDFSPKWDIKTAVQKTVEWEKANLAGIDITESQIKEYFRL